MWKLIRIILLLCTVVIVSGMHAAAFQGNNTRRLCGMAGTAETATSSEEIILGVQDEHMRLVDDLEKAYLEIEHKKSLPTIGARWGIINTSRSLAYNIGIRLFSFLSGLRVSGDVLAFDSVCSIDRLAIDSGKKCVKVTVNLGAIDRLIKSMTALEKVYLQAVTADEFLRSLVKVLSVCVTSQESTHKFESEIVLAAFSWEDFPIDSQKLTTFCA